jgi:hypothetical protein
MKMDYSKNNKLFTGDQSRTYFGLQNIGKRKKDQSQFEPYQQVFDDKHGF